MEIEKEDGISPEVTETIPNYLVRSTIVTMCCFLLGPICFPLGAAALVYSNRVDVMLKNGDIAGARQASQTTKMLVKVCWVCLFICLCVASFLLFLFFYWICHSDM